jgi:23S rRNA pseudouridine2457 synthase
MPRLYMLHKPFGVLSQFTSEGNRPGLASLNLPVPREVYPIGRLDADSEGLLMLTDDNRLKTRILDPNNRHERTYHVQVEGNPSFEQIQEIKSPMTLNIKGKKFVTRGCQAERIAPTHPDRIPPIRIRKTVPDAWISLTLTEGKNRQVRRMTAAVGLPTLRLIRVAMGPWELGDLGSGEWREIELGL